MLLVRDFIAIKPDILLNYRTKFMKMDTQTSKEKLFRMLHSY
jgi:hypothetical protein